MPFKKGESGNDKKKFPKGASGNPKGYPKGVPNRATMMRKVLAMKMKIADPLKEDRERLTTVEEAMILGLAAKAISGDVAAVREFLDTVYGTNKAHIDLTTKDKELPGSNILMPSNGRD